MPRNILLFMTDQQRTDYVGYAADSCVSTPNIDWDCTACPFYLLQYNQSYLFSGAYLAYHGTISAPDWYADHGR